MAQLLLPELIEAIKLVPVAPNTLEVRRQIAMAVHTTCTTFGADINAVRVSDCLCRNIVLNHCLKSSWFFHVLKINKSVILKP